MANPLILLALLAADAPAQEAVCADRPGKANGVCTVPAGHVQVETGLIDWTRDRSSGERSDFMTLGASAIKFGLSTRAHVEIDVAPFAILRTSQAGSTSRLSGIGDTTLRMKLRLTADGAPVEIAAMPFVKLPTARHGLGNGKFEGGIAVPVSHAIGNSGATLTLGPELDLLADSDDSGRHVALANVVNIGAPLTDRLSVGAELWGCWDFDSAGTSRQASADAVVALLATSELQLDAGLNAGLKRDTPDVELYAGVSKRF